MGAVDDTTESVYAAAGFLAGATTTRPDNIDIPPALSVPLYIIYDDLIPLPILTAEDQDIHNFWSTHPHFQEWVVRALLERINLAIHAWVSIAEHGSQLSDNAGVVQLFEMLGRAGKHAMIPTVTWVFAGW